MSEDTDNELVRKFLQEKPCRVLYAIQNLEESERYATNISKMVETTYAHTVKIVSDFEDLGLIRSEKEGRTKLLTLTEDGEELADAVGNLYDTFEDLGENLQ